LTNPLGEWLRAHAEVMKIRWKTHAAHTSTALLTYYRSCPKGYFHFLSFIRRKEEISFTFFKIRRRAKERDRFADWSKNLWAHFNVQYKWNFGDFWICWFFLPFSSVLGSFFWTSFQHFY
jgi:hypothetical protein